MLAGCCLMSHNQITFEQRLVEILRKHGYSPIERPNNIIEGSTRESSGATKFSILVEQDGWLLFVLRLVNKFDFTLENINEFNRSYRFGKLCLDREGGLYFSADMRVF